MKGNLSIDRESVRLLAIELGVREAARRCGLSEDRVRKWSSRYKWLEQRAPKQQEAAVTVVTTPGDVLLQEHKALESTTKSALMQTAAKAAVSAAQKRPWTCPIPHSFGTWLLVLPVSLGGTKGLRPRCKSTLGSS